VDVGSGPGRFVLECAKTCRRATGLDVSPRFIEYARARALRLGFANAAFENCDFSAPGAGAAGLAGAFDLAFASLTPAINGPGCLERFMGLSRARCCAVMIARQEDSLVARAIDEAFGGDARPLHDGSGFHALCNLLWLSGYEPETFYIDEEGVSAVSPEPGAAANLARLCRRAGPQGAALALAALERMAGTGGAVERRVATRYGAVLWRARRAWS